MKICKCEKSDKKPRVNLTTEKNYIKKARMCFRWELNSRPFIMAEVKIEKNCQKKEVFCFLWELNSRPFIMAEEGNYLENRSNGYKYSNLLIDGRMFLMKISRIYLFS